MESRHIIDNKVILVTGGTGEFGHEFVSYIMKYFHPKKIIVFSHDEGELSSMRNKYYKNLGVLRFFVGDIRDKERLCRAFKGVDYVVHMASMNDEVICEYNPREAILTNILGTQNVIEAAIDNGVEKVIAVSTDKAVYPSDMYGSVKLVSDQLMIAGNLYSGDAKCSFSVVRFSNVVDSKHSDLITLVEKRHNIVKKIAVSDYRETRFWTSKDMGIRMVVSALELSSGGEIFVCKAPSYKKIDLIKALVPDAQISEKGITPSSKIHEILLTTQEAVCTYEYEDFYVVYPYRRENYESHIIPNGNKLEYGFSYNSANNTEWLSEQQINTLIKEYIG